MNLTQAFNLFMRFIGNKLIHRAVNSGIDYAARRGKPEAEMSEAERAQAASGRAFADRAKQIRNATRRFFDAKGGARAPSPRAASHPLRIFFEQGSQQI